MARWWWSALVMAGAMLATTPDTGSAQQLRSFAPSGRKDGEQDVPREYRPPRGMCRIWIEGVPPDKQPAPTDCATAVKNKPRNGRVIFGEDAREDGPDKKDKDKPKKPEG